MFLNPFLSNFAQPQLLVDFNEFCPKKILMKKYEPGSVPFICCCLILKVVIMAKSEQMLNPCRITSNTSMHVSHIQKPRHFL